VDDGYHTLLQNRYQVYPHQPEAEIAIYNNERFISILIKIGNLINSPPQTMSARYSVETYRAWSHPVMEEGYAARCESCLRAYLARLA
jgi:hypothetical protein